MWVNWDNTPRTREHTRAAARGREAAGKTLTAVKSVEQDWPMTCGRDGVFLGRRIYLEDLLSELAVVACELEVHRDVTVPAHEGR